MTSAQATPTAAPGVDPRQFTRFADFYPFYLGEHSNRTCRRLHFLGSTLSLVCLAMLAFTGRPQYLLYGLLCGYGLAWVGHFVFEKNKPASFKRPLYSFMGDWAMYRDIWLGRVPF
ncbi:Mpo1-like protein [Curvibacter gracilis]|uniref:Mpo1-like protein n=1 Tax=Curvibacter gracilis TaxID=230310 RepID=UPI000485C92A|nr:Mpo1-like protein [Curvibacter gracilis]